MLWTMLLLDLVPLIVFTILDAFGNMRYALIGAVLSAILNLLYSHLFLGGIDAISLVFVVVVSFLPHSHTTRKTRSSLGLNQLPYPA